MAKIRLTKEFQFEMAHALWNYDGLCKHIHGHSYKLFVTVIGEPLNDSNNVKHGMVIDFGVLKKIVNEQVVNIFDHSSLLSKLAPTKSLTIEPQMFDRLILSDYQPTCENMIVDFADRIKKYLPENVKLFSLKLYETATSYAEWFTSDNE